MSEEEKKIPQVSFSPDAEKNLEEIENHIAGKGNAEAAEKVVDEIINRCGELADMPRSGRARDGIAPGVRSATSGMYVIYYRVHENRIEILRVWHGSRDHAALKGEL
jgi:toxin ParE1/3/4